MSTARARASYRATGRRRAAGLLNLGALLLATAFFLFPIAWALLTSLKQHRQVFSDPPLFVFTPTLENYAFVLSQSPYLHYLRNSLVVSLASAFISTFVGALAAYAFSRFRVPGERHLLTWILSLRMLPPMAVAVPFYLMAVQSGLYDTRAGLALVLVTVNLPIAVWMQVSYLNAVPVALDEAALIDGCSRFQALVHVVLPLAAPGVAATLILAFIFSWNEFPLSVILTSQNATTLPVSMIGWDTQRGLEWGNMMAAGMMAAAPVMAFAILIQRWLVRGLTLGAIVE